MKNGPAKRYRYRLMELMQPSNALTVYSRTSGKLDYKGKDWFTDALNPISPAVTGPAVHVLAENVITLVLQPKLSKRDELTTSKILAPTYAYDSTNPSGVTDPDINPKNQLPPIVQVTVVAIDEASASRIAQGATPPGFDATLNTLFLKAEDFDKDLTTLQSTLLNFRPPINARVFTSSVSIRGAKWSRN
jgi:uncharacterized protein (TIGR02599 family)